MRSVSTDLAPCRSASLYLVKAIALILVMSAAFPTPAACAGSFTGPNYSGGTCYAPGPDGTPGPQPDASYNGGWGGGSGGGKSANCGAPIKTTFTWNPTPGQNDPPPQSVITIETSKTDASGASYPPGTVGGSCADGFGHTQSMTQSPIYAYPGSTQQVGTSGSATLGGTRYGVKPGDAVSLTCTPTASASASSTASSDLTYTVGISPVTINPVGAVKDSSGGYAILVGQGCSPVLNGIPGGTGWSVTYQWSVSGTTFQTWSATTPAIGTAPANPNASYYVDGPGPLNGPAPDATPAVPAPHWYWNDLNTTTETISCTATVTPPAGQGNTFTVTATQKVKVMVPNWTCTGTGGTMQVNTAAPQGDGSKYFLWAGPIAGSGETGGMDWNATVSSPASTLFGDGSIEIVQIVTPFTSYIVGGTNHSWSLNGQRGLDTVCPYPWVRGSPKYFSGDCPGSTNLTGTNMQPVDSALLKDAFNDYLLYQPPGSDVQWVPLATFDWSTNGSVTIPNPGGWAAFGSGSAGPVTPSGTPISFSQSNSFPMWTQNDGVSNGHWQ